MTACVDNTSEMGGHLRRRAPELTLPAIIKASTVDHTPSPMFEFQSRSHSMTRPRGWDTRRLSSPRLSQVESPMGGGRRAQRRASLPLALEGGPGARGLLSRVSSVQGDHGMLGQRGSLMDVLFPSRTDSSASMTPSSTSQTPKGLGTRRGSLLGIGDTVLGVEKMQALGLEPTPPVEPTKRAYLRKEFERYSRTQAGSLTQSELSQLLFARLYAQRRIEASRGPATRKAFDISIKQYTADSQASHLLTMNTFDQRKGTPMDFEAFVEWCHERDHRRERNRRISSPLAGFLGPPESPPTPVFSNLCSLMARRDSLFRRASVDSSAETFSATSSAASAGHPADVKQRSKSSGCILQDAPKGGFLTQIRHAHTMFERGCNSHCA
mmetsp:Transcript_1126/g.2439  ORF Transcript_1126/g.2439 Transcript_1126/m.2439 type:complete len:382 (+) Transcript_1126:235-1380(+)